MFGFGNDLAVRYARNEQRHACRSSCIVRQDWTILGKTKMCEKSYRLFQYKIS